MATTLDKADLELAEKFRKEYKHKQYKSNHQSFPVGSAVKNLPATAGDTRPVPGLGRSHMPRTTEPVPHKYQARAPQPPSLYSTTASQAGSLRSALRPSTPAHHNQGKPRQQWRPSTAQKKLIKLWKVNHQYCGQRRSISHPRHYRPLKQNIIVPNFHKENRVLPNNKDVCPQMWVFSGHSWYRVLFHSKK